MFRGLAVGNRQTKKFIVIYQIRILEYAVFGRIPVGCKRYVRYSVYVIFILKE